MMRCSPQGPGSNPWRIKYPSFELSHAVFKAGRQRL